MKMKQGLASVRLYFRAGPPISHLAERMTRVVALPLVLVALFSGCSGVVPKKRYPRSSTLCQASAAWRYLT